MREDRFLIGSGNTLLLLPNSEPEGRVSLGAMAADAVQSIATDAVKSNATGPLQSIAPEVPASASPVSQYISAAIAGNTRRAYQQDLKDFLAWGGVVPCSPENLAAYIADRAQTASVHTITRRLVGIGRAHVSQGFADPSKTDLVRTVIRGVRRVRGTQQRQVSPLLKSDVLEMIGGLEGVRGMRDRALILLGFAAALRRSELAALDFADLEFVREGLVVKLRRSKTDQEGQGRKIGIPWGRTNACQVKAVEMWLQTSRIESGPVFRQVNRAGKVSCNQLHAQSVALILKGHAKAVGLNPATISGHSLRSGLVTSAVQAGVAVHKIQQQTGHRSVQMLARYIRDAGLFENNASGGVL